MAGEVDLEKELTCSICTDVLYQPLTLLDCLHTFCGSCLREWFTWQASSATSAHPYTCPSCRSPVRDTRPNATVTTLLDLYLRAHPEKQKSEDEKVAIAKAYKQGDNVIPPVRISVESDSEDDRMLEEARELSLEDTDPDRARRRAVRAERHQRRRRQHDHVVSDRHHQQHRTRHPREEAAPSVHPVAAHRLEHQSSLRSLLSEIDSHELEDDIMRQIAEDGLLDGIDVEHLTSTQEEEITERIVQAVRRRQNVSSTRSQASTQQRRPDRSPQPTPPSSSGASRNRPHTRSESGSNRTSAHDRPPISQPHLLNAAMTDGRRQPRSRSTSRNSQSSSRSANRSETALTQETPIAQIASQSTTSLSDRPRTSSRDTAARPVSRENRRTTDPEGLATVAHSNRHRNRLDGTATVAQRSVEPDQRPRHVPHSFPSSGQDRAELAARTSTTRLRSDDFNQSDLALAGSRNREAAELESVGRRRRASPRVRISDQGATTNGSDLQEPVVSCSRCQKPNIQYTLHYNCSQCDSGSFNLCLECYRAGQGCYHWFGQGYSVISRYQRSAVEAQSVPPHILSARRYAKPDTGDADPQRRLAEGLFCENCFNFANSCYWHCHTCNDGAWGFCDHCVQTGHHCTHPLEALLQKACTDNYNPHENATRTDGMIDEHQTSYITSDSGNKAFALALESGQDLLPHVPDPSNYTTSSVSTRCDVCSRPIPPSHTRFHCLACKDGNYDICNSCYYNLCGTGKISAQNGVKGWRRCLRGHRLVVAGFEDREGGQKRIVVRDLVGGWALKEEDMPSMATSDNDQRPRDSGQWSWKEPDGTSVSHRPTRLQVAAQYQQPDPSGTVFPPDGGVGLRVQASWPWFPSAEKTDELSFPRFAEIREAEDINGDWFWGVYAGRKGVFPGNYGRIVSSG